MQYMISLSPSKCFALKRILAFSISIYFYLSKSSKSNVFFYST